MNGPVSMYKMKPIVHFPDPIALTPTMYRMKNMYTSISSNFNKVQEFQDPQMLPNVVEQVNKLLQKPESEIEELRKRQEAILTQLSYLKEQMLVLREELSKKNMSKESSVGVTHVPTSSSQIVQQPSWSGVIGEIVVHASPDCPPYSLLAVNQLWPQGLRLHVTCHTHSSIGSLPPHLSAFSALSHTPSPTLHARLIWKRMGPDCELVISPLSHCPVRGEVNLLRYLYRSVCKPSDPVTEVKLDSVLDISHQLTHARTVRDKQAWVRALNAKLGKTEWLCGDIMSIADIAAWSAVRAVPSIKLSQNMARWQSRCCSAAGVEAA